MESPPNELRYEFGKNWKDFLEKHFSRDKVERAGRHLLGFLHRHDLKGTSFLDIGCGSGIHSLAAWLAEADHVTSFDYDPESVAATRSLWVSAGSPANWTIQQGSILDQQFVQTLPLADIVYSWGVLHHTGQMWNAVRQAASRVKPDGLFYIALYTTDVYLKPTAGDWLRWKKKYNHSGAIGRWIMEWWYAFRFNILPDLVHSRNPFHELWQYGRHSRGRSYWTDVRDWLGGWPMEFAGISETRQFCQHELSLELLNLATGEANTEYLFRHLGACSAWNSILQLRPRRPLPPPYHHEGNSCFSSRLPELQVEADEDSNLRRSPWTVIEDGRPLNLGHCLPKHIIQAGGGRYSHFGERVFFSASDDSDPNSNGRTYELCQM